MPRDPRRRSGDRLLARRLGQAEYDRRRAIEEGRILEHRRPVSPQLTALKIHVVRPLLHFGLHTLGLYRHGHRQFRALRVRHNEVRLTGLPPAFDGFVILHLSDLHLDLDPSFSAVIVSTVRELRYDLAVMTGDYRNSTIGPWQQAVDEVLRVREALTGPVFAVLGNHDAVAMVPPLEAGGVRFLLNESTTIRRGRDSVCLAGIDDPNIYRTHSLHRALRGVPPHRMKILLSHSPAIHREAAASGVQLVLAGHTHGGQVCLPGGRILIHNDRSPRHLLAGVWRWKHVQGYTSPGTGSCGLPIRFNCPPEVTLHTLRRPE